MTPAATNQIAHWLAEGDTAQMAARLAQHPGAQAALAGLLILGVAAAVAAVAAMFVVRPNTTALGARPWTPDDVRYLMVGVMAILGAVWLAAAGVQAWRPADPDSSRWKAALMAAQSFAVHWAALAIVARRLRHHGASLSEAFSVPRRSALTQWLLGMGLYLAAVPFVGLASWASHSMLRRWGIELRPQDVLLVLGDTDIGTLRAYLLFVIVGLAPIAEEVAFRGVLFPALARTVGAGAALGVTALLFAAVHMHTASAAPLFVLGLAFGLAYLYTGSLLVPIAMHASFNTVSLALASLLSAP